MEDILRGILSNDNAVRKAAETQYNQALGVDVGRTIQGLVQALNTSSDAGVRETAVVLLQRLLRNEEKAVWKKHLNAQNRAGLRSVLLEALSVEQSKSFGKKLGVTIAIVAELAQALEDASPGSGEAWSDLLMKLVELSSDSKPASVRAAALETMTSLAEYAPEMVLPHSTDFCKVVAPIMRSSSELQVCFSAYSAGKWCKRVDGFG